MREVRPELLIVGAAALWGTTGTAQDLADLPASPVAVGVARILVGGAALAAVAIRSGGAHPRPSADTRHQNRMWVPWGVGILAVAGYQASFFAAVDRAGVALGTLVAIGSAPAFTGVIAFVAHGERPIRRWYPATGLAIAGSALMLAPGGDSEMDATGLALALGAGLAYAVYTVAAKSLLDAGVPSERAMAGLFLGGAVVLAPALLGADTGGLVSGRGIVMVLWLGLAATAVAYLLFGAGLARLRSSTVATLSLTEPLMATFLGVVVLGERPGLLAALGAAVLLAGLVVLSPVRRPAAWRRRACR